MEERRSGADRRQYSRRKEDRETPYNDIKFNLECNHEELKAISDAIHEIVSKKLKDKKDD